MFEQTVLRPAPLRGWAVMLSFGGELALIGCVLAVPVIWPQLLPRREVMSWLAAPLPPPPPIREAPFIHVRPIRPSIRMGAIRYAPPAIPQSLPVVDEPPIEGVREAGVREGSVSDSPLTQLFDPVVRMDAPKRPPEPAAAVKPATGVIQQLRVSGAIQAARLGHRVDPVYPALARQARIAGTVELAGIIGTDGRIRELRVVSGHPLLVKAALDAVRQWIYEPTLLGGNPVEVITTISVNFRLN